MSYPHFFPLSDSYISTTFYFPWGLGLPSVATRLQLSWDVPVRCQHQGAAWMSMMVICGCPRSSSFSSSQRRPETCFLATCHTSDRDDGSKLPGLPFTPNFLCHSRGLLATLQMG